MTARDDLDAWLDEGGPWEVPEDPDAPLPVLADAEAANRWLRRIARLDTDEREVKAVAFDEVERIEAWRDDRLAGIHRARAYAESVVEAWLRAHHASGGGQSVSLPNGTPSLRKAPSGSARPLVLDDEHAKGEAEQEYLRRLAETHPTWVNERLSLVKDAVKAATTPDDEGRPVTADGEVIAGMRYVKPEQEYAFSVKPSAR